MEESPSSSAALVDVARTFFHRLLAVAENRLQLFMIEAEEERNRLVDMVFMAIATATLGLLGAMALSAAIVIYFWPSGPVFALLILGGVYMVAAVLICVRLAGLRRQPPLPATIDQLRKDRACLKES